MKKQMLLKILPLLMLVMGLCSCATVGKRIATNQAMFDTWPQETQQKIREETIAVGFSRDMVLVALGKPQRIKTRTSEAGDTEIWSYLATRSTLVNVQHNYYPYGPVYCPPGQGRRRGHYHYNPYHYTPVTQYESYETVRVVFTEGKVSEIEALN